MKKLLLLFLVLFGLSACTDVGETEQPTVTTPVTTTAPVTTTTTPVTTTQKAEPVISVEDVVKSTVSIEAGEITSIGGDFGICFHEITLVNPENVEIKSVTFVVSYEDANGEMLFDEMTGDNEVLLTLDTSEPLEVAVFMNSEAKKANVKLVYVTLTDDKIVEFE